MSILRLPFIVPSIASSPLLPRLPKASSLAPPDQRQNKLFLVKVQAGAYGAEVSGGRLPGVSLRQGLLSRKEKNSSIYIF